MLGSSIYILVLFIYFGPSVTSFFLSTLPSPTEHTAEDQSSHHRVDSRFSESTLSKHVQHASRVQPSLTGAQNTTTRPGHWRLSKDLSACNT